MNVLQVLRHVYRGGSYNGAKSTLRQITTTITITLTIFILLMHLVRVQGTKVGAGRGHPMPNLCKP